MLANQNRFAMLSMDDDDEEKVVVKEQVLEKPVSAVPVSETREKELKKKWNLNEGRPESVREWNLEAPKTQGRRGPFSRYAFRDDDHGKPRAYAFRDDSPPAETRKPVSPEPFQSKVVSEEEFPTLSDYVRPMTPPYPPDDGWYPTLAERIRVAMERKEAPKVEDKKVFNMDTVIPMPTRVNTTLHLE